MQIAKEPIDYLKLGVYGQLARQLVPVFKTIRHKIPTLRPTLKFFFLTGVK